MTRRLGLLAVTGCVCVAGIVAATSAYAAFPGTNGKIAFDESTGATGSTFDIFAIDPTGANRVQLTATVDEDFTPAYSADGERIAFTRYPPSPNNFGQIWVMNHNGTGQTQVTAGTATADDYGPSYSPDGTKIVFDRYDGTASQIWIMDANGTGQTQLTVPGPNADHGHDAAISPNGQRIAFSRFDGLTGVHSIVTMNLNGTGITQVTPNAAPSSDFQPDWSPDGSKLVFRRGDDVLTVNADGSGPTTVVSSTASFDNDDPVYSPQGTQLAFDRGLSAAPFTTSVFLAGSVGLDSGVTPLVTPAPGGDALEPTWQPLNPPACNIGTAPILTKTYGSVTVTATCTNEAASLVASGTGKAKKVSRRAVARKAKTFTIPPVTALIPKGVPTTVTLAIPKGAKKRLKKAAKAGKKGKATITATATDGLGQTSTSTIAVTFQPKKKK